MGPNCYCKTYQIFFNLCRIFGLIPGKFFHQNRKCYFRTSIPWTLYILYLLLLSLWCLVDSLAQFSNNMMFITMLIYFYKVIAPIFSVFFYSMTLVHRKEMIQVFNHVSQLPLNNLLCKKSLRTLKRLCLIFAVAFEIACILALSIPLIFAFYKSGAIPTPNVLLQKILQFVPAGIVGFVNVNCLTTMIYLTNCFKSIVIKTLKYKPKLSKDNNFRLYAWVGLFRYDFICTKNHRSLDAKVALTNTGKFDCLRGMHEIVDQTYDKLDSFSKSYLPICIVVSLGQIILFLYIFVVIFKYDEKIIADNYLFFVENYVIIGMNIANLLVFAYLGTLLVNEVSLYLNLFIYIM